MEAVTAGAARAEGTGSKTIADLLPLAVKKYGDKAAQRYKVGDEWVDTSYAELGEVVREVALGLDRPRHPARRQGLDPGPHAARVDPGVLRHPHRRRHPGHDLPDELAGGVPVRPRALGLARDLRRGRGAAGEDPRGRGSVPRARARGRDGPGGRRAWRRALARRSSASAAAAVTSPSGRRATRPSRRRTSASTSTRPAPPARRRAACSRTRTTARSPTPSWMEPAGGGRLVVPLPAARARVRDPDPVRHLRPRRHARLLVARREDDHRGHRAGEAELLPVGAADVREDLHARHLAVPTTRRACRRPSRWA